MYIILYGPRHGDTARVVLEHCSFEACVRELFELVQDCVAKHGGAIRAMVALSANDDSLV